MERRMGLDRRAPARRGRTSRGGRRSLPGRPRRGRPGAARPSRRAARRHRLDPRRRSGPRHGLGRRDLLRPRRQQLRRRAQPSCASTQPRATLCSAFRSTSRSPWSILGPSEAAWRASASCSRHRAAATPPPRCTAACSTGRSRLLVGPATSPSTGSQRSLRRYFVEVGVFRPSAGASSIGCARCPNEPRRYPRRSTRRASLIAGGCDGTAACSQRTAFVPAVASTLRALPKAAQPERSQLRCRSRRG